MHHNFSPGFHPGSFFIKIRNKNNDKPGPFLVVRRMMFVLLGTFIMSIAINALYLPHGILSGGITGISLMFHLVFGIDASVMIVIINIPIFIFRYFFVNKKFVIWSFLGMALWLFSYG